MILGVSTGSCFNLGLERIEALRFLKQFNINAVELMFASADDVFDFHPQREDVVFVRSKKYVSLHAPFIKFDYCDNAESKNVLRSLNEIALKFGAEHVVFHEHHIKDYSLFNNLDFVPLVENLNSASKKKDGRNRICTVNQVQDFLLAHKNFGFCLDLAHALLESIEPKDFLVLGNRIKQCHLHFPKIKNGERKPHGAPSVAEKNFLLQVKPFLVSDFPLLAEWDFEKGKEQEIASELELLKNISLERD